MNEFVGKLRGMEFPHFDLCFVCGRHTGNILVEDVCPVELKGCKGFVGSRLYMQVSCSERTCMNWMAYYQRFELNASTNYKWKPEL